MIQSNLTAQKKRTRKPMLHEVEIIYTGPQIKDSIKVQSSKDSHAVLKEYYDPKKIDYKEMFYVLLLNRANYCLGISKIAVGSTTGVIVNIKEIFQLALKMNASALIISHNHPSGNLMPSDSDNELTKKVKQAATFLELNLLDHIIVTSQGYYSYADEGQM